MSSVTATSAVASDPVIQLSGVNFAFGRGETRTQVLFDVELEIGRGEIVIMTGPSGSGKTTLLTLIGALRHVQAGSVRILGRELAEMSPAQRVLLRRDIGFIFQHHNLFSSLTAAENVRMASILKTSRAEARNGREAALLDRLGLGDRLDYLPSRLSGGQRQRVAIARALVNTPELILADEPTAALDAESGAGVLTLLHQLASGPTRSTVLIVTHDQRLIDRADRIVNMVSGRIVSNVRPALSIRICMTLARTKELAWVGETLLARLADIMTVEYRSRGEIIVHEGEHGDRCYVIGQGTALATRQGAPARTLTEGGFFGRITDISQLRVDDTVQAETDLELYRLTQTDLQRVLDTDKDLETHLRQYYMSRQ
jgi:putative ABC transport system ATP-binding protein